MFKNLKAEMVRNGINNKQIADTLGVDISTVSAKLNSYDRLKLCEADKIRKTFFPDMQIDYLFAVDDKSA